jgi:hypothetical protein
VTSIGSTGSGVSTDNGAATSNGLIANLHLSQNDRDGASTIKIQHSVDDTTFVDLLSFSPVSASTVAGENLVVNGNVNRYLRMSYTLAGTSGSIRINTAAARR